MDLVLDTIEVLGKRGVQLAVFPECMLSGYGYESREEALKSAISLDSPEIRELVAAAKQSKLSFTLGLLLRDEDRLYNAALVLGGTGALGRYHKIHLPHLGVDRFVDRGEIPYQAFSAPVSNSGGKPSSVSESCQIGLGICYDSSFPEPIRALGLAGADVIALGTNWPVAARRTAEIVPPARSMENHLFFVAANRIGKERGFQYCGLSSICGPDGVELARAKADEPTVLYAEVDLNEARNKRIERTPGKHVIDRFADRRPEFYGAVTQLPPTDSSAK